MINCAHCEQLLDVEIAKARSTATRLEDLEALHAAAAAVNSTTEAFIEFTNVVDAASRWQRRTNSALKMEYSCTVAEIEILVREGEAEVSRMRASKCI